MVNLVCPECSHRYSVETTQLEKAKRFRCKRCKTISPIEGNVVAENPPNDRGMPEEATPSWSHSAEDEFALAEKMLERLEASEDIDTIFETEGKFVEMRGNAPLLLNTSDHVWLVHAGCIDIFSVLTENGETVGTRSHLLRLEPGRIFFGVDSELYGKERALIAVGSRGSSVLQLDVVRIRQLADTQEFTAIGIATLIDQWIAALSLRLKEAMIPQNCNELTTPGDVRLEGNICYKPEKGLGWIRHHTGTSAFMGLEELPVIGNNGYFPVSEKIWLQTCEQVFLHYTDSSEIVTQDLFWFSLEHFHLFLLESLILLTEQRKILEQERLKRKADDERLSLKNAFVKLFSVLSPDENIVSDAAADPLLSACRAIGRQMNIEFVPHPDASKGMNTLEDIARASGVRMRRVVLKGKWWRRDNGSLLAYREEDTRPVALLPGSSRMYVLFDPAQDTRTKVTAKVAASLEGLAYSFYEPFPDHALSWRELAKLGFRGLRKDVAMVAIMGILGMLLGLLTPYTTGIIFDTIIPSAATDQLIQIGIILTVCALATAIFEITKAIAMLRIKGQSDRTLQAALWDRLLTLPTPFFRQYSAGDLAVRSMGIIAIRKILAGETVQSLLAAIFSIGYWGLLFYYDKFLALIATGVSLLTVMLTLGLGYLYIRCERPLNDIQGKISGLVLQLITGISKLRITGTEDRAFAIWAKEFSKQRKLALKSRTVQNILATVNSMTPMFASMLFFYCVLSKIMDPDEQGLSTGKLLAFLSAYGTFQNTLLQMSSALLSTLGVVPLYQRLKPILTTLPEVDTTKSHPGEITGNIEVTQVHFRYQPDGPLILKDVSLQVNSGEFIGIVGASGSGKSTLMRLLLGFELPESGAVYYDGQALSNVDLLEIRRQIGVVLQNSQIMRGSIFDNIVGAGSARLTLDDAWAAARMAGCEKDIRAMPMQMHTVLPPGGGSLSGGQRQRIFIARAVVKKPRVLFFDEATSALDNSTQAIVSKSIAGLQATRIVIAHRLSTIRNADRIYVMDKGRIVQTGAYHELLKQEGVFAELAKRQMA